MKDFAWILLLICLVSTPCAAADTLEIYVRNKLLQGEVIRQGDEIYVSASELKKLLKEKIEWDSGTGVISIDGNATALRLIPGRGTSLAPLKAVAKLAGYEVSLNKSTGIMDIFIKTALKQDAMPAGGTPQAAVSVAPEEKKKDLLTIEEKGTSSVMAVVTNGRAAEARNVVATCTLKTQDGAVFTQQDQKVGTMKASGTSEVLFYFPAAGGGITLQRTFTVRGD